MVFAITLKHMNGTTYKRNTICNRGVIEIGGTDDISNGKFSSWDS